MSVQSFTDSKWWCILKKNSNKIKCCMKGYFDPSRLLESEVPVRKNFAVTPDREVWEKSTFCLSHNILHLWGLLSLGVLRGTCPLPLVMFETCLVVTLGNTGGGSCCQLEVGWCAASILQCYPCRGFAWPWTSVEQQLRERSDSRILLGPKWAYQSLLRMTVGHLGLPTLDCVCVLAALFDKTWSKHKRDFHWNRGDFFRRFFF